MITDRQRILINYLLKKLNFKQEINSNQAETFESKYIEYLEKTYKLFKNIGNCEAIKIKIDNIVEDFPKDALLNVKYVFNGKYFELNELHYTLITYLFLEIDIKSKGKFIEKFRPSSFISATDIANYTYCPVSYSISKTFEYIPLENAIIGINKHEKSLINKILNKEEFVAPKTTDIPVYKDGIEFDENYNKLIELLNEFEVIYSGHNELNKKKFFKNDKISFVGQPDYILQNKETKEIIVIEEKYQYIPKEYINYDLYNEEKERTQNEIYEKREHNYFYKNHINQVSSYLFGIKNYNIKYALLVYWKYEIRDGQQIVTKCFWKKIEKDEKIRYELNITFNNIKKFIKDGKIPFDKKILNPKKCASCVNNFLCGHKTSFFDVITLPYKKNFLVVKNVKYPEALKNEKNEENNEILTREKKILENIEYNTRYPDFNIEDEIIF